jgi:hypothetical protein
MLANGHAHWLLAALSHDRFHGRGNPSARNHSPVVQPYVQKVVSPRAPIAMECRVKKLIGSIKSELPGSYGTGGLSELSKPAASRLFPLPIQENCFVCLDASPPSHNRFLSPPTVHLISLLRRPVLLLLDVEVVSCDGSGHVVSVPGTC